MRRWRRRVSSGGSRDHGRWRRRLARSTRRRRRAQLLQTRHHQSRGKDGFYLGRRGIGGDALARMGASRGGPCRRRRRARTLGPLHRRRGSEESSILAGVLRLVLARWRALLKRQRGTLQGDAGGVVWRTCGAGADRRSHHQKFARGDMRAGKVHTRSRSRSCSIRSSVVASGGIEEQTGTS